MQGRQHSHGKQGSTPSNFMGYLRQLEMRRNGHGCGATVKSLQSGNFKQKCDANSSYSLCQRNSKWCCTNETLTCEKWTSHWAVQLLQQNCLSHTVSRSSMSSCLLILVLALSCHSHTHLPFEWKDVTYAHLSIVSCKCMTGIFWRFTAWGIFLESWTWLWISTSMLN